mmetsp:Transcript_108343/g.170886  ORF Transcript_108343/g.170886 Transcript_108343/m.170886 type:complete len:247 (+) Transcript_108343:148-888(+)
MRRTTPFLGWLHSVGLRLPVWSEFNSESYLVSDTCSTELHAFVVGVEAILLLNFSTINESVACRRSVASDHACVSLSIAFTLVIDLRFFCWWTVTPARSFTRSNSSIAVSICPGTLAAHAGTFAFHSAPSASIFSSPTHCVFSLASTIHATPTTPAHHRRTFAAPAEAIHATFTSPAASIFSTPPTHGCHRNHATPATIHSTPPPKASSIFTAIFATLASTILLPPIALKSSERSAGTTMASRSIC